MHEIGAAYYEIVVRSNIGITYRVLGNLDAAADSLETAITLAITLAHPDLPQLQALLDEINAQRGSERQQRMQPPNGFVAPIRE